MPHGTLEVVLVSAKGLEDTDFLSKIWSDISVWILTTLSLVWILLIGLVWMKRVKSANLYICTCGRFKILIWIRIMQIWSQINILDLLLVIVFLWSLVDGYGHVNLDLFLLKNQIKDVRSVDLTNKKKMLDRLHIIYVDLFVMPL